MGVWRGEPGRTDIEAKGQSHAELQGITRVKLPAGGGGENLCEDSLF